MKNISSIFFLLSTFFSIAQTDTALNKMRSVRIKKPNKIALQSNIANLKDIAVKNGKDNYCLKKGTFSGTE